MSSKLGWRLLLLLSLAHKVIAEMKNAPEGAFLHAFLAEWTGHSDYNLKPLYINEIKGFQQLYVVKICGEIVKLWRFLRCLLENLHQNT